MALQGTFSNNIGYYGVICEWTGAQSVSGNYTDITAKVFITYYALNIPSRTVTFTIAGQTMTAASPTISADKPSTALVGTFTKRIVHNTDGTATVAMSAAFPFNANNIATITATDNVTLDTIPQVSHVSTASGTLGTAQAVTVTIPVSGYVNTITATAGSHTQTLATQSSATSLQWTPDLAFAQAAPQGTAVSVIITCTTYASAGGALVGESYKTVTMTIPASVKPTVSIVVSDFTSYSLEYGNYVQGLSRIKVEITGTGAQGSAVTGFTLIVKQGSETIYNDISNNPTMISPVINKSGSITVQIIGTDTRGRTATATSTVTFTAYDKPGITALKVERCTAGGTLKADGEYCKATFSAEITPLSNHNSAAYKVLYRIKDSATSFTEITVTSAAGQYTPTDVAVIFAADPNESYEVCIEAEDDIAVSQSGSRVLPIGRVLMQATADGTGIAFGAVATESNTVDHRIPARFRDSIIIDNLVTSDALTINAGAGTAAAGDCWVKKDRAANIVELHIYFNSNVVAPVAGLCDVTTLPSSYRPSRRTYCTLIATNLQSGYAYIETDGTVVGAMPTTGPTIITATYHNN